MITRYTQYIKRHLRAAYELIQEHKRAASAIAVAFVLIGGGWFTYSYFFAKDVPTFKKEYKVVLTDYAGKEVRLSEFKHAVLVVYVWASWCPYCGREIQNLAQLKETYGEQIQVVAVNRAEPVGDAKAFTDALEKTDGVVFLLDPTDSFFKSIGGYAMPETVFIRPNGEILLHQRGPMKITEVEEKVKQLVQ